MKIIIKADIIQKRYIINRDIKKQVKEQRYRAFLQNPTRPLPGYKSLVKVRTIMVYVCFLCISLPCIQIIFFYNTIITNIGWIFPSLCGTIAWFMVNFAVNIDYVIYKRWGYLDCFPKKQTLINWVDLMDHTSR